MWRHATGGMIAAVVVCVAACDSPTDTRGNGPMTGVPQYFYLQHWTADNDLQTLFVEAWGMWGVTYTSSRAVTAETLWTSSNPSVARIVAPGRIQSVSPGEVTLTATLDRFTVTQALRVFPGDAPVRALSTAIGTVRDSSMSCCGNLLAGVTLDILTGYNAGRSTVTDARGQFTLGGPVYCGESMIRMSKSGYREVMRPLTWCSELPQPNLEMAPGGG